MSELSRRDFLFLSSGAAAGSLLAPGLATAEGTKDHFSRSGLVTGAAKPLRYKSIPGFLSAEQLAPHHTSHYGGALRGYSAADVDLEQSAKSATPTDPNAYGAIQRARTSKGNSVLLHELYFDGMVPSSPEPPPDLRVAIDRRFGSVDRWAEDFEESAKAAAGWAMLAVHSVNGKLYNVVSDEHAQGPLWMTAPVVVIDVYEHAFYIDYQSDKHAYVEKFIHHIDWAEASLRYRIALQ